MENEKISRGCFDLSKRLQAALVDDTEEKKKFYELRDAHKNSSFDSLENFEISEILRIDDDRITATCEFENDDGDENEYVIKMEVQRKERQTGTKSKFSGFGDQPCKKQLSNDLNVINITPFQPSSSNTLEQQVELYQSLPYHKNIASPFYSFILEVPEDSSDGLLNELELEPNELLLCTLWEQHEANLQEYLLDHADKISEGTRLRFCAEIAHIMIYLRDHYLIQAQCPKLSQFLVDSEENIRLSSLSGIIKLDESYNTKITTTSANSQGEFQVPPQCEDENGNSGYSGHYSFYLGIVIHLIFFNIHPFAGTQSQETFSFKRRKIASDSFTNELITHITPIIDSLLSLNSSIRISPEKAIEELSYPFSKTKSVCESLHVTPSDNSCSYQLAEYISEGIGVLKSTEIALELFIQAANAGNVDAQIIVADTLASDGNTKEAAKYFKQAADLGNSYAEYFLSEYFTDYDPQPEVASDYLHRAARNGNEIAQYNLGLDLLQSNQEEEGLKYILLANDNGFERAAYEAAMCYRDGIGTKIDKTQMIRYLKQSAESGDINGLVVLGLSFAKGDGCKKNLRSAFSCFKSAAREDDPCAMYHFALCFENATGTVKNYQKALKWFHRGAERGEGQMEKFYYKLAKYYLDGLGTPSNIPMAIEYFELGGKHGSRRSYNCLGKIYEDGEFVPQDLSLAAEFYSLAANLGLIEAQENIARMYAIGDGVPVNLKLAKDFFRLAAEQGSDFAIQRLRNL